MWNYFVQQLQGKFTELNEYLNELHFGLEYVNLLRWLELAEKKEPFDCPVVLQWSICFPGCTWEDGIPFVSASSPAPLCSLSLTEETENKYAKYNSYGKYLILL